MKLRQATDEEYLALIMDERVLTAFDTLDLDINECRLCLIETVHGDDYSFGRAKVYIAHATGDYVGGYAVVCPKANGGAEFLDRGNIKDLVKGVISVPIFSPNGFFIREWL